MTEFEQQDGISFLIIYFSHCNEYYYVPYRDMMRFWNRAGAGGRKSFRREELDQSYRIRVQGEVFVHYLEMLQRDLDGREN